MQRFFKTAHAIIVVNWDKKAAEYVNANEHQGLLKLHIIQYKRIQDMHGLQVVAKDSPNLKIHIHASNKSVYHMIRKQIREVKPVFRYIYGGVQEVTLRGVLCRKVLESMPFTIAIHPYAKMTFKSNIGIERNYRSELVAQYSYARM